MAIRFPQYDLPPDLLNSRISGAMATCGDEVGPILFGDFFDTAPATVTGTMAVTEGVDTFSASGDVFVVGAMAASESGADVATMGGDVIVQGLLAATEQGADECVASGQVVVSGTMDAIEQGSDDFASTGSTIAPTVKRGGSYAPTTRQRAVKHLVSTRESEDDRRKAIAQIMAMPEVEPAPSQLVTPHHIPSLVSSATANFDLSPVIIGAAKSYTDTLRSFVAGEIQREADRIAANLVDIARSKEMEAQQVMQGAMFARMLDEDEATALIFIMATA